MKSLTAVCQTGASMPAINPNGRISRHPPHRGDGENAEMKMYLSKLKDLVPFMPKNRKLSKLEIIQHVIDYICDLQSELETHPEISNFDAAAALNFTANLERVTAAANNGHHDEDDDEEEEDEIADGVQERLNGASLPQQQQHSSPAQRQPLADRQTPNTILPATQHQQQQTIVSAVNNTTTFNSITTSNANFSSTAAADNTTTTQTAAATNLSHTVGYHCKKIDMIV